MKFLIDQNRSPRLALLLRRSGHDAVHTLELGLERSEDEELLQVAIAENRIVVSGDTDFGTLLADTNQHAPSVILFRGRHHRSADQQAELILTHLDNLQPDLDHGAIIVITDQRIRIRRLPVAPAPQDENA